MPSQKKISCYTNMFSSGETNNAILEHSIKNQGQQQKKKKAFDVVSMLTASIANRRRNNCSSCAMFPRVVPQLWTNIKGQKSL